MDAACCSVVTSTHHASLIVAHLLAGCTFPFSVYSSHVRAANVMHTASSRPYLERGLPLSIVGWCCDLGCLTCAAPAAESSFDLQLKIFFPDVTVAKPKSSRNSSIGKSMWFKTCDSCCPT